MTRGSFYHHFRDRADLLSAVLDYWQNIWTLRERERERVEAMRLEPADAVLVLIRMIRHHRAADYDVCFRAWALHDKRARCVVEQADRIRLDFIRQLFEEPGFRRLDAENRARLFLYYEMTEPSMFAPQDDALKDELVVERHKLLTRRS